MSSPISDLAEVVNVIDASTDIILQKDFLSLICGISVLVT